MKRFFLTTVLVLGGSPVLSAAEPTSSAPPAEVQNQAGMIPSEGRAAALAAARVFTKEGFRIRDGEWNPASGNGVPSFLQVTLFAGEEYGFAAATLAPEGKPSVTLFDASGKPVKSESCETGGGSRAAVRIAPRKSGAYFVKLEFSGGPSTAADVTLVYCYK